MVVDNQCEPSGDTAKIKEAAECGAQDERHQRLLLETTASTGCRQSFAAGDSND